MVILNGNEESDVLYLSRFSEMIQVSQSGVDVISGKQLNLETLNIERLRDDGD